MKGKSRDLLLPSLTIISASIQPTVPSFGMKPLISGPPPSLTRSSLPRLPVMSQASSLIIELTLSVACWANFRTFGLSCSR